jgi:hypothetical protein
MLLTMSFFIFYFSTIESTNLSLTTNFKDLKIIPLNHLIHFFDFKKPFYCFLILQFGFANFFLVYYLFHLPKK